MLRLSSSMMLGVATVLFTAASPSLICASQEFGRYHYNCDMVYFWVELIKLMFATSWRLSDNCVSPALTSLHSSSHIRLFLTAFLYFVQNNLGFPLILSMDAVTFQVLMTARIPVVTLLSANMLGKHQNGLHCHMIFLLCMGGSQHFLSLFSSSLHFSLFFMLVVITTSALGNISNQFSFQMDPGEHFVAQNFFLYLYGALLNGINWALSIWRGHPPFGCVSITVVVLIFVISLYGLCISAALMRFGALQRSIFASLAIVATGLGNSVFSGIRPHILTVTAHVVTMLSSQGYALVAKGC